ncbi:MAG: hypothetical protein Q9159_004339 [Coniocarpon cinnabarinum]
MSLASLSDELILLILSHTDIPELLNFSRTTHRHRRLSLDPLLHQHRRSFVPYLLSHSLSHRPSLSSLHPPAATIYLTSTHVLARTISRQLVAIRLNRNLAHRPSAQKLVTCNILPRECCSVDRNSGEWVVGGRGAIAPGIVETKRRVEKERLKDGLRAWLERKAEGVREKARTEDEGPGGVRRLVRRFTARWKSGDGEIVKVNDASSAEKWPVARRGCARDEAPTRAHVYSLRRFWEGVAQGEEVRV